MTHDGFVAHRQQRHAPLFRALPEMRQQVRRCFLCHAVAVSSPGLPPARFDGITELWFDDVAGLETAFAPGSDMQRIRPDGAQFLDLHGCGFALSTENGVIA